MPGAHEPAAITTIRKLAGRREDPARRRSLTVASKNPISKSMKITSKGQVTIPVRIREKFGLLPDTEVVFEVEGNVVRIRPAPGAKTRRGKRVVDQLRGRAGVRLSTDEILSLTRGDQKASSSSRRGTPTKRRK